MSVQHEKLDVLIIGAGIAGIGMAYNMVKNRKNDSFAVIESRDNIGGTGIFLSTLAFAPTPTCIPMLTPLSPGVAVNT